MWAVDTAPAPSGLVSTSTSPGLPPAFVSSSSGWTIPVTAIPYFGSASSIEWPPRIATSASAAISAPPRRISARITSPSCSIENATRFRADTGTPPIA